MAGTVNVVRSFIAIELPPEVLRVLEDLQARLGKGRDRSAKWAPATGIHLTLKFLGDVPADRIPLVAASMSAVAAAGSSLALQLSGAGCFPNSERPRVLWAGLAGDVERLARMQATLEDAMAGLGFAGEARGFSPHLTLARVRDLATPDEVRRLGSAVKQLAVPRVDFEAGELALIRSDLLPSGAVYTVLASALLGGALGAGGRSGHRADRRPGSTD
jgi:RNA 2',3'-cyclic 3'-phosphodiesterase